MTDFNADRKWCGYCELCERDLWSGDYRPRDGKEICQECSEELDFEDSMDDLFEEVSKRDRATTEYGRRKAEVRIQEILTSIASE